MPIHFALQSVFGMSLHFALQSVLHFPCYNLQPDSWLTFENSMMAAVRWFPLPAIAILIHWFFCSLYPAAKRGCIASHHGSKSASIYIYVLYYIICSSICNSSYMFTLYYSVLYFSLYRNVNMIFIVMSWGIPLVYHNNAFPAHAEECVVIFSYICSSTAIYCLIVLAQ
jgi:hypothetical protein